MSANPARWHGPWLLAAAALCLLLPACGKGRKPCYPVTGKVLVDGKPAPDAFVHFHPVEAAADPADRVSPFAMVDDKGRFALSSYVSNDGAPEGEYIVTFEWRERSGLMKNNFEGPDRLKGAYVDPKKSKYKVQIKPEPNELPTFELTTK